MHENGKLDGNKALINDELGKHVVVLREKSDCDINSPLILNVPDDAEAEAPGSDSDHALVVNTPFVNSDSYSSFV